MTDADRLEALLSERPMTQAEILSACDQRGWPGMTVHSRVADLRARGRNIVCDPAGTHRGRVQYRYTMTPRRRMEAVPDPAPCAATAPGAVFVAPHESLVTRRGTPIRLDDRRAALHIRNGGDVRVTAGGVELL